MKDTIDQVFNFAQSDGQQQPRFDLYISSYVKFWNADTDHCDNWTFARWFSTGSPKIVKALRAEINELVGKYNDVAEDVIRNYQPPDSPREFHVHFIPISDKFEGHRFCEPFHSFDDQFYSADVWFWNLSWKNSNLLFTDLLMGIDATEGDPESEQDEDPSMNLETMQDGVWTMGKPPNAQDGPYPILSLDATVRDALDDQYLPTDGDNATAASRTTFGWMGRPFHPKPRGYNAMKDAFIGAFRANQLPGVKG